VVTADEIPDPQALTLRTRVNGEVMQDSSTAEMVFGVAELLAFCSRSFTLEPGDVVLTGTPWGCGEFMNPPRSLTAGDVLETEIEGIGRLRKPRRRRVIVASADRGRWPRSVFDLRYRERPDVRVAVTRTFAKKQTEAWPPADLGRQHDSGRSRAFDGRSPMLTRALLSSYSSLSPSPATPQPPS
jgi:hypothetical protein